MNDLPIHVIARSHAVASNFIRSDLGENPRRLRFVECGDQLKGIRDLIVYVHPTATEHLNYEEIMHTAKACGFILAYVDDSYPRARFSK